MGDTDAMVLSQPLPSGPRGLSSPGQVFSLSLRDVELILVERGIVASCETVRRWCQVLLQTIAEELARCAAGDRDRQTAAQRRLLPGVEHRQSRYLNNRAHRPTRRRERQMQRFKSFRQAQDFLSAHAFIYGHLHPRRHRLAARAYRVIRSEDFKIRLQETGAKRAA
jgi:transposase-like protein